MAGSGDRRSQLDSEVAAGRNNIRTDKLDITYGELANMYAAEELRIDPEYQRLFRWTSTQKSLFVESLLLGFPTPAIFVAEDENGIWELVDGLQRVSTVFEFMGVLRKPGESETRPASTLVAAERHKPRLLSVEGIKFEDMSLQLRLSIKRAGCRVEVIKVGSQPTMKYEVFERLNTGGSGLTPQEVRNCIFRAMNPEFVEWVEGLANFAAYHDNLGLSEHQQDTMFDKGLVLRYLTMKNAHQDFEHDVEPFITNFVREVVGKERRLDRAEEERVFKETFQKVADALGEDSWRHYRNGKHTGPFSVYVFEAVSVGIAHNLDALKDLTAQDLKRRIISFKQDSRFTQNTGAGANIKSRLRGRMDSALSFFAGDQAQ